MQDYRFLEDENHPIKLLIVASASPVLLISAPPAKYGFQQLVDVGLRKLLTPWEENAPEQREYYYSCFAA